MRTWQQAIDNPEKGDKWGVGDWVRVIMAFDRSSVSYAGARGRWSRCSYRTFRRWASKAEYLGGAA